MPRPLVTPVMCELFALSSRLPTRVGFSLERLARHGGIEGPHRDGWGVAYYEGRDAVIVREPRAAGESALVRYIERFGPPSDLIVSHIRLATQGERALHNTQPFQRELGGRVHVFAHNGRLAGIDKAHGRYRALGNTDSEQAFCALLEDLAPLWDATDEVPALAERLAAVGAFAARLRPLGPANFLYADAETLFVHAHRRTQADGHIAPPGLYRLTRHCEEGTTHLSDIGISLTGAPQELILIASVPLTKEPWQALAEGEVLALQRGRVVARLSPQDGPRDGLEAKA